MASSPVKKFSLFLLFTLLFSPLSQARDTQSFSKFSAAVTNQEQPPNNGIALQEPSFFLQENETGHGLYHRDSAPATEQEEYESDGYGTTENSYTNNLKNYYGSAQEEDEGMDNYQYKNGGSSALVGDAAAENRGGFGSQGMSDTRSLENGKYYYDINVEKYGYNHPYAVLNRAQASSDQYRERNYYGVSEDSMGGSYENQYFERGMP